MSEQPETRKKFVYVGAPACFLLEAECQLLRRAFGGQCYLVGSALERPNWRDIDVRMMLDDEDFDALFPDSHKGDLAEFDARWIVMTTAISEQLSRKTGLPVDFQFQRTSNANKRHSGRRNALGLVFAPAQETAE